MKEDKSKNCLCLIRYPLKRYWVQYSREQFKNSTDGYCIFHAKAEDKSRKEFNEALRNYIKKTKAENDFYDFRGFVFVGDMHFRRDFKVAIFEYARFGEAVFHGDANFGAAEFQGYASFCGAKFEEEAMLGGVDFRGFADFREVKFQDLANFSGVVFHGGALISPRHMEKGIILSNANLENIVLTPLNLGKASWIDFKRARLRNTEIRRKDIEGYITQERASEYVEAKEIYLLLKNNFHTLGRYDEESWAFTKEKEMERKSFLHSRRQYKSEELGEKWEDRDIKDCFRSFLLDLKHIARFVRNHWFPNSWAKTIKLCSYVSSFFEHPSATVKSEFTKLKTLVVRNIKGRAEDVTAKEFFRVLWFYIKYALKYFWSTLLKFLYGWGEWPWLIFLWCAVTIFAFSGIYCLSGDVITKDGVLIESYLKKLYFSGVTFTALGYGDYSPIGWARFFAFLESFLGIFFIALFVFSFARRTAGR